MSTHPFIRSTWAAARNYLQRARLAQDNALIWGQWVYLAGYKGSTARRMVKHWHAKRAVYLGEALAERRRVKLLVLTLRTSRVSETSEVQP